MLTPFRTAAFKRDARRQQKRGKDMSKLRNLLLLLIAEASLPEQYLDHPLKGSWAGYRDAHIEPDWLLIYRVVGDEIRFTRTGTHADILE
jgi:mRNA interferase YafQ